MNHYSPKYWPLTILTILVGIFTIGSLINCTPTNCQEPKDYPQIKECGILRVATDYGDNGVLLSNDTLKGFYYELAKAFAAEHNLQLEIIPKNGLEGQKEQLLSGKADLIITGIVRTTDSKDSLLEYTEPVMLDKQVLVQKKPLSQHDSSYIKNQLQLARKTVAIPQGSAVFYRIRNLSQEIGDTIYVHKIDKYQSEQLMALVAHDVIPYAVCDAHTVENNISQYPQLDVKTDISFNQFYSWGVSKDQPILLDSLNHWIKRFKQTEQYKQFDKKYYK